jgi:hypothetical protein
MNRLCMALLCTATIAISAAKPAAPWPEFSSFAELRQAFASPPAGYSTAPFFVWNGEITETEIDAYLADYNAKGIRAFFIHPRPGLITPYLSERWFSLVRHTVEEAARLGMEAWLYDENSYPSGFAGGNVAAEMPESYNQGQGLTLRKLTSPPASDLGRCDVLLRKAGDRFERVTPDGASGEIYCFERAYYPRRDWTGGFPYVDLLKPGVTQKFIDVTMRGYEKSNGSRLGAVVPGIFTDEPNIAPVTRNSVRWTPDLFEQFRKLFGYDLATSLPSLLEETGEWRKVRHDYYALVLDLFIERWAKPWYNYTESKGMLWTGHYWEHEWPNVGQGPDTMAMDAWFHVPGVDMLGKSLDEDSAAQFGNVRAVKEISSIANQTGRRRKISESYGGAGWDLSYEDMKRLGDWEYALGVNLMNQHLSWITMVGARKADYPQSFSYQNPWWKHYKVLADYYARLSAALSSGEERNRILILEPTTSSWMYAAFGPANPRMKVMGDAFQSFITRLQYLQVEYDLASEQVMRDRGKAAGGRLEVGRRSYDVFVIPPEADNLESSTLRLLKAFASQGGKLLAFSSPAYVDGSPSSQKWTTVSSLEDAEVRSALLSADITVTEGSMFHHRRTLSDGELLFFSNHSMDKHAAAELRLKAPSLVRMDLFTGKLEPYNSRRVDLAPAGSLLLYAGRARVPTPLTAPPGVDGRALPMGAVEIRRLDPNVLTIDYCDLKIGEKTEPDLYYAQASRRVFLDHGLAGNPWNSAVQYKTGILDKDKFSPGSGFDLTYRFNVEGLGGGSSLRATIERPGLWKVAINGSPVDPRPGEWAFDRAFGVYDIGFAVKEGENLLTLAAHPMSVHHEVESVYITGEFGLVAQAKGFNIVPSAQLALGSWKAQRLPMYPGDVAYSHEFKTDAKAGRYFVRLGRWRGSVAEVRVNGQPAGIIGWQPYECEITSFVRPGTNRVEVIVTGSLRNRHGPHHRKTGRIIGPGDYHAGPASMPPGDAYLLMDYGLMEDFRIIGEFEQTTKTSGTTTAKSAQRL